MRSVEVTVQDSRIVLVSLSTRTYRIVGTIEHWHAGMRWWRGEWPREYYWLETHEGYVLEVYSEVFAWMLSAVQD